MQESQQAVEVTKDKQPDMLSILPLFEAVLFPKMVLPLVVMQGDSVQLVDEAMTKNRVIGLLVSKKASDSSPSEATDKPQDPIAAEYVRKHRIDHDDERYKEIHKYLKEEGDLCDVLPHGAEVYEVDKQNVCITTGLSPNPKEEGYRQLIFFPPNILTTSWTNPYGGRIL